MLELLGTWRTESEFIVWIWRSKLTIISNPYVNSNEADSWNPTESWGTNTGPTLAIPGIYRVSQPQENLTCQGMRTSNGVMGIDGKGAMNSVNCSLAVMVLSSSMCAMKLFDRNSM